MISHCLCSLSPLIFHVLFATSIGGSIIKILQINDPTINSCDNYKWSLSQNMYIKNFVSQNHPDVILWFSKSHANCSYFHKINETYVLPVYGNDHLPYRCSNFSGVVEACYYKYTLGPLNISFAILNTGLWLSNSIINESLQQMVWLKGLLKEFELKKQTLIIVGYDTPGSLETSNGDVKYALQYNNDFEQLLRQYSRTVRVCLFASDTVDSFRIVMDNAGHPVIPLFISPIHLSTQLSPPFSLRIYSYNTVYNVMDNYIQYKTNNNNGEVTIKYNFTALYNISIANVANLFTLTKSLNRNRTANLRKYYQYQLTNILFHRHCNSGSIDHRSSCNQCFVGCYIVNMLKTNLNQCLTQCMAWDITRIRNNNAFFIVAVIVGFVVILVGIVFAVNKGCCAHRSQRNIVLAPLTLNVQSDIVDDAPSIESNGKLSTSKDVAVNSNSQTRTINGHRRLSCDNNEQTYDYIRM